MGHACARPGPLVLPGLHLRLLIGRERKLDWKTQPARRWIFVGLLVALVHGAAWLGLARLRDEAEPARAFKVIEAALLRPPQRAPRPLPAPAPPRAPVPPMPPAVAVAAMPPEPPSEPAVPTPMPSPPAAAPQAVPMTLGLAPAATAPPAVQAIAPVAPAARPAPPVPEPPRYIAAYLNNPPPAYPAAARRRGHEGRVLVRAEVLADGRCNQVMLKASSGHDLLDRAAMDAVQQWRFVPARQGDQAVDAWVDVPITFKLND